MMNPTQFITSTSKYSITPELVHSLKLVEDETTHTTYAQMLGGCVDTASDGLFWAFQSIINTSGEYSMQDNRGPAKFIKEKLLKTEAAEKLSQFATEIKQSKIKLNEFVDELTNNKMISVVGLYALCLVHKVSITYIFNNVYIIMNQSENTNILNNACIIRTGDKFTTHIPTDINNINDINLTDIYDKYFCIDDISKPIKPITAYTAVELRDICIKLELPQTVTINDKIKSLTKLIVYNNIKQYMIESYFIAAKLN